MNKFVILMVLTISLVVSLISLDHLTTAQPSVLLCVKSAAEPTDPVEMNTAIFGNPDEPNSRWMKSTYTNKQSFTCARPGDPVGSVYQYKDITIYMDIYGKLDSGDFLPHLTQIFSTACIRNSTGDYISCRTEYWSGEQPYMKSCAEETPVPPIEMNTVSYGPGPGKQLRTIASETHTYKCIAGNTTIPNKVKDVVNFMSFYQMGGSTFHSMAATCVMDIHSGTIDYCTHSGGSQVTAP